MMITDSGIEMMMADEHIEIMTIIDWSQDTSKLVVNIYHDKQEKIHVVVGQTQMANKDMPIEIGIGTCH